MRITSWIALLQLVAVELCGGSSSSNTPLARQYDTREYYAVHLSRHATPHDLAGRLGLDFEGKIGELDDHYLFSGPKGDADVIEQYQLRQKGKRDASSDGILFAQKQKLKRLVKRIPPPPREKRLEDRAQDKGLVRELEHISSALDIRDPIFHEQWHLFNTVEQGHDVNVTGLWLEGITGHGSTVAIVDDGLDMYSDDLKDNYFAKGSYDFNDQTAEPRPRLSDDRHGTRCAGEIAAVRNNVCGVGVAYDAKVAGIRILSKQISDADEAVALNYAYQDNQIYSCSWGPPDDGKSMEAPGILIKKAILKGINQGRGGLGSIFVFASGNGAANGDNCNFDGYTNSIYSITVGAVDRKGNHPYYSEHCSAQMVVTYSSGSGDAIHTTDVGTNKCYSGHGGTSAAAPLAAGIFALVLSVRPELTWRDLQYLSMDTAVPINVDDGMWEKTALGKLYSHRYGYGKLDAYAIVQAAKTFKLVKPQTWYKSPVVLANHEIPQGQKGLRSEIEITEQHIKDANVARLEHVQVRMNAVHGRRGDLSVDLISPNGVVSHIATKRDLDNSAQGYENWDFMTVKHWGEDGIGKWAIIIRDTQENEYNGTLVDWSITLWGEAINADLAEPHPLPGEENKLPASHTTSALHTTTDLPSEFPTDHAAATGNPTDHLHRPVNSKPGSSNGAQGTPTDNAASPSSSSTTAEDSTSSDSAAYLPSFLPTFGVSAKTQAWMYGAIIVIALFIGAVAVYLLKQRRKAQAREDGMNYEFEALGDADLEEGGGRSRGGSGGGGGQTTGAAAGGRRKARDLYDAFGASDDEEELFSDDNDEDGDEDAEASEKEDYYDHDAARGIDESGKGEDRQKLLGRENR